jgi:hypothetical protein
MENMLNLELGAILERNDYNNATFLHRKPLLNWIFLFKGVFSFVAEYEFYYYYNKCQNG